MSSSKLGGSNEASGKNSQKPSIDEKLETMTIPQKHIVFAKDNLTHIVVADESTMMLRMQMNTNNDNVGA